MKVIFTTDLSRDGNDCWINKSISLVRVCEFYAVIVSESVSGWWERKSVDTLIITTVYEEAVDWYKSNGGNVNEAVGG